MTTYRALTHDLPTPEVGGGVKCWGSWEGGWSYIVAVSRSTVTILDNWGNGGRNFERSVPFALIREVVSRAKVEGKRSVGQLAETPDRTRFYFEVRQRRASAFKLSARAT